MDQDFGEVVQYLDGKFKEVNEKVDTLTVTVNTLQSSVDGILKDRQIKTEEMLVLNHRMKNTEYWIDRASPKLGIKLKH